MTKERYFKICEELGKEPDPAKIPPGIEDFPPDVQKAILIFNKLGDRILPDIGYLGKETSLVPMYARAYGVENERLFLETLERLDAPIIKKSADAIKQQRERLKAGSK